MDTISIYQTVYTVLFVLAGVFFAMSIVFFFLFDIRSVMGRLYGRSIRGVQAIRTGKKARNESAKNVQNQVAKTAGQQENAGTVVMDGQATVMTRFLETMMLDQEDNSTMETSTEALSESVRETEMLGESAKQTLDFRPVVKILEYSAGDRI